MKTFEEVEANAALQMYHSLFCFSCTDKLCKLANPYMELFTHS